MQARNKQSFFTSKMKTFFVDANVVIRFLLHDHPSLSPKAREIFLQAEKGKLQIYLDEVILAEIVWTLSSFYKIKKMDLIERLEKLLSQSWIVNQKKKLLLETFNLYRLSNLDYIDCWAFVKAASLKTKLTTFDRALQKKR